MDTLGCQHLPHGSFRESLNARGDSLEETWQETGFAQVSLDISNTYGNADGLCPWLSGDAKTRYGPLMKQAPERDA